MTKRITVIGGAYGSGKTEFAIAYSLSQVKTKQSPLGLIDLDIVNPYFRSRDLTAELAGQGIDVISTQPGMETADMPALSPRIYTVLQDGSYRVIFDVGGDPVGARALGRFNPYFKKEAYDYWVVVNPFRPDTRNPEEAADLIAGLEAASRLKVNGLVSNINLGPQTSLEDWQQQQPFLKTLTEMLQLPVVFQVVEASLLERHPELKTKDKLFPLHLKMLPPWLVADK